MRMDIWEAEAASSFWDRPPYSSLWSGPPNRRGRRLRRQPDVITALIAAFESDPQTARQLAGLHYEQPPEYTSHAFLYATWKATGIPVIVKLNVDPWERYWMTAIDRLAPALVSRVFAGGEHIGPYALRWLVLEHLPYALSHEWGNRLYDLLAASAVRFQAAARMIDRRYVGLVCFHSTRASIEQAIREGCPGPVQRVLDRLEEDWIWVNEQCGLEVCFGDLTMGNAAAATPPPGEKIFLIDPLPRVAPWAWDAAYCQTLDATTEVRMVQRMAVARQAQGLTVPEPAVLDRLATILLAWLGARRWWSTSFRREDPEWHAQIQRYMENAASLNTTPTDFYR